MRNFRLTACLLAAALFTAACSGLGNGAADQGLSSLVDAINAGDVDLVQDLTELDSDAQRWSAILATCRTSADPAGPWEANDFTEPSVNGDGELNAFSYKGTPVSDAFEAVSGFDSVQGASVRVSGAAAGENYTFYAYEISNEAPLEVFIEFFGFSSGDSVEPFDFQYADTVPSGKNYDGCLRNAKSNPPNGDLSTRWNFPDGSYESDIRLVSRN